MYLADLTQLPSVLSHKFFTNITHSNNSIHLYSL